VEELPQDPITALQQDHRRVEALYAQFQSGAGDSRRSALEEIVRELSVHAEVEEQVIYPAMRQALPDGEQKVEHAIEEHQTVKEILVELDGADPDDESVSGRLRDLMAQVSEHVAEEEAELLPELRVALGPVALTEMGQAAEKARSMAPTRPHPHAPSSGAAQAAAGAVAGAVDRARDAARSALRRDGG
jgi:hemerythrin superfamily protein